MGYTTDFTGSINVSPPLNVVEATYLRRFAGTRRMRRWRGPYFVEGSGFAGQDHEADVLDYNNPPEGQPGLWCKWEPNEDGTAIEWNGVEKFYDAETWMAYLIDHFLKPGAVVSTMDDPQFVMFSFDHTLNGVIEAQGEDPNDLWRLIVRENMVSRIDAQITWPDPNPAVAWPTP